LKDLLSNSVENLIFAGTDGRHADWESTAKATLDRALRTPINTNVARNVILFLGDGMGVATVTAGRIYAAQQQGRPYGEESSLAFERFPHVGLSKVRLNYTRHLSQIAPAEQA